MSGKHIAKNQPASFIFSEENKEKIKDILKKYPDTKKKSAIMPLLYLAQKQNNNWIPLAAIKLIASMLNTTYIKVYEVATFYSMYNLAPVGKYFVQVCTTTPCMIRGSGKIVEACKQIISKKYRKNSPTIHPNKPPKLHKTPSKTSPQILQKSPATKTLHHPRGCVHKGFLFP